MKHNHWGVLKKQPIRVNNINDEFVLMPIFLARTKPHHSRDVQIIKKKFCGYVTSDKGSEINRLVLCYV